MKKQLIQEVQRQMLPFLNNAQLKQLQSVLEGVLSGVELSYSAGMVESAKVDTVVCFINAKRIEGCSEKTLSYYRQTIVSMLSGIDKEPQEIVTEDLGSRRKRRNQARLRLIISVAFFQAFFRGLRMRTTS